MYDCIKHGEFQYTYLLLLYSLHKDPNSQSHVEVNHTCRSYIYTRRFCTGKFQDGRQQLVNSSRRYVSTKPMRRLLNQELVEVVVILLNCHSLNWFSCCSSSQTLEDYCHYLPWSSVATCLSQLHNFSARTKAPAITPKLGSWVQYLGLFRICCLSVTVALQMGTKRGMKLKIFAMCSTL